MVLDTSAISAFLEVEDGIPDGETINTIAKLGTLVSRSKVALLQFGKCPVEVAHRVSVFGFYCPESGRVCSDLVGWGYEFCSVRPDSGG